jgi:hypothetical protein
MFKCGFKKRVLALVLSLWEQLIEYQQAARMTALQSFILDLEKRYETCADILSDAKNFSYMWNIENVLYISF